jgi:ferric-dicitrate binding protein FerR (iron transport regulator)
MTDQRENGPVDRLLADARAHRAPPALWPAIAERVRRRAVRRPWLRAAALVLGGAGYLLAAAALRPPSTAPAGSDGAAVAVAWQYFGHGAAVPTLPEEDLLRLLTDVRRNR